MHQDVSKSLKVVPYTGECTFWCEEECNKSACCQGRRNGNTMGLERAQWASQLLKVKVSSLRDKNYAGGGGCNPLLLDVIRPWEIGRAHV